MPLAFVPTQLPDYEQSCLEVSSIPQELLQVVEDIPKYKHPQE
jgi:hypothetical protein